MQIVCRVSGEILQNSPKNIIEELLSGCGCGEHQGVTVECGDWLSTKCCGPFIEQQEKEWTLLLNSDKTQVMNVFCFGEGTQLLHC